MKDLPISKIPSTIVLSVSLFVFLYTFVPNFLIYTIPIIPLFLLFIRNRKILSFLSIILFFYSLFIFLLKSPINSFSNFSLFIVFLTLLILILVGINSFFPLSISIIILFINIYVLETLKGGNIPIFIISFITILISLFINHVKDKDLYLWENRFIVRKNYKKGIAIFFVILIAISLVFPLIPEIKGINIPSSILTLTPKSKIAEKPSIKVNPEKNLEEKNALNKISIGKSAEKILSFFTNYIYLISLVGLILFLILSLLLIYRSMKDLVGKKKALKNVLYSTIFSFVILTLLYLSYIPFTKLIKKISRISGKREIGITNFKIDLSSYFYKTSGTGGTPVRSVSIDILVILVIIILSLLATISIILFISHLYSETFGKKAERRSLLADEFRVEEDGIKEEFFGTPREKILKLYRILLHKLRVIRQRNIYETPFEYKEKVEREKPIISKEMDLITENFVLSRYSNYNIDEGIWEKTKKAFIKIKEKLFKEVMNG